MRGEWLACLQMLPATPASLTSRHTNPRQALAQRLGGKDALRATTGLPLAPYFSASKLLYLLDTVDGLRAAAEVGG